MHPNAERVMNGAFDEIIFYDKIEGPRIYMDWDFGQNPITVSGKESDMKVPRLERLAKILEWEDKTSWVLTFTNGEWPSCSIESVDRRVTKDPDWELPFDTVEECLLHIHEHMGEKGLVYRSKQEMPLDLTSVVKPWDLSKETYTNEEVRILMEMMKAEFVETTNQLFDRMLGRLAIKE
ncbi:hypothetical protein D9_0080 [Aeromonas phage D9]|nr:hypothetical protein D9_0080 [Aeromonas phage D9]